MLYSDAIAIFRASPLPSGARPERTPRQRRQRLGVLLWQSRGEHSAGHALKFSEAQKLECGWAGPMFCPAFMCKGQPPGGQFILTKSMTVFDGKAGNTLYANEAVNFQTIRSSHMRSRKFFCWTDTEQNAP